MTDFEHIDIPDVLPLLPVRDMVMYPSVLLPLFVGRDMSINAVEKSLSQDRLIVVAAQKDLTDEDPLPERIYTVGVVSQIMRMLRLPDGRVKVLIQGLKKAKIEKYIQETPTFLVRLATIEEPIITEITLEIEALMRYVADEYGRLDILVNSQGVVHLEPLTEFDVDAWQRVMDVNLKSVFLCGKHAARLMLAQGRGRIINVSSVRGFQGRAQDAAYAPSKGAVNQLTRSLAIEWGPRGLNVNGLAPVFTRTAMAAPMLDDPNTRAWILSRIAMKRPGELEDLFGPVVFLASDASDFVNGHILAVDGGWLAT